jgi:hypothetical protein
VYLKDPSIHSEGRKRVVDYVCGNMDGRAGEKMAAAVESIVNGIGVAK